MRQMQVKILGNEKVAPDFFKMRVGSTYLAKNMRPGQFLEVKCSGATAPLLRRPFGLHRKFKGGIEFLYEVVGEGTELLSKKGPGELLDMIAPLGNGFKLPKSEGGRREKPKTILIAGGIGVAPLVALAESLRGNKYVLLGARKKSHVLCEGEFKKAGAKVLVSTDDGSKGRKGFVTDLLKELLSRPSTLDPVPYIYACGPNVMLKAVWEIAKDKNIPCQFSFEEHMACGVGVCLGCPIKVRKGLIDTEYKMICKDGPVFKGEDIAW